MNDSLLINYVSSSKYIVNNGILGKFVTNSFKEAFDVASINRKSMIYKDSKGEVIVEGNYIIDQLGILWHVVSDNCDLLMSTSFTSRGKKIEGKVKLLYPSCCSCVKVSSL